VFFAFQKLACQNHAQSLLCGIAQKGERHCREAVAFRWLRGVDLNHRPLGYAI
jgi:hypothetical protein